MVELELVGIHDDGEHLVFKDPENRTYRVAIDETLRAAVRRDRPQLEQLRSHSLRPRDIQALIRAGSSAEDIAEQASMTIEQVRRYEGPVLAERSFVATRAQTLRVGREPDSPALGDLVIDRLAARNIPDVEWDSFRPGGEPWHVVARYTAGGQAHHAEWEIDLHSGHVLALDDEAKWLSEIDLADSPYRHLTPVHSDKFYDVEADGGIPPEAEDDDESGLTDTILAELDAARGVRQPLEQEAEEPTLWDSPPAAHPPLSRPQDATDATVLSLPASTQPPNDSDPDKSAPTQEPESAPQAEESTPKRRTRRRRTSVPSWDEIVFGAKND